MIDKRQFEIKFEGRFADGQMLPIAPLTQVLSPFYVQHIEYGDRKFEFIKPLELTPELDEVTQLHCIVQPELGIDVYAYTRDQLDLELREQIAFLWDTYAMADDAELTDAAVAVKQNLLATLREMPGAA